MINDYAKNNTLIVVLGFHVIDLEVFQASTSIKPTNPPAFAGHKFNNMITIYCRPACTWHKFYYKFHISN